MRLQQGSTSIDWLDTTNGFIDERGVLAFDLAGGVAVLNFKERSVKCGPYRVTYNPIDMPLMMVGKGLRFGDVLTFDFQKGIIHFGDNAIKVSQHSTLNITEDGVEILFDSAIGEYRLDVNMLEDEVCLSANGNRLLLPSRTNVVLDRLGHLAFELDHQLALVQLPHGKARIGGVDVHFVKGSELRIVRGMLKFQEGVLLHGRKRLLQFGQSRVALPKKASIFLSEGMLKLCVKKKEIMLRPYHKQVFIRVGGKLIILTVSVGVSVDQNGNLAFDYRGNLAIMDTTFMVLTIDGVKLDMSKANGVVVEMIGTTAIVSAQSQPSHFLEWFKQLMSHSGLQDMIKGAEQNLSTEELIELLMTVSDPAEIMQKLQQAGVTPDAALLDHVKELLASMAGIDPTVLLMLSSGQKGTHLQIGGRTLSMPSPLEMTEALSVGGVDSMQARIKGNKIFLNHAEELNLN